MKDFRSTDRRGMSLAFILLFVAILSFLIVPIVDMFSFSRQTAVKAKNVLTALNLASEKLEELKSIRFSAITGTDPDEWQPAEGEWFNDGRTSIPYPAHYAMFKRNVRVTHGEELPGKDPDLVKVVVTVKWEEVGESRSKVVQREVKLATLINRKERWE